MTGIVGWWPLNETSGVARDVSGNGNDGTINDATLAVGHGPGGLPAMSFDGTDDFIEVGSSTELRLIGDVTLSAWMYVRNLPTAGNDRVVAQYAAPGDSSSVTNILYGLRYTGAGSLMWFHEYGTGSNTILETSTTPIVAGSWIHVVANRDDSEKEVSFYCNGNHVETIPYTNSATDGSNSGLSLCEDNGSDNITPLHDGLLSDVRIYNRTLSPLEAKQLYQQGVQASDPLDGVARYRLDGNANDSFKGNDGVENSITYTDGKIDQAASFVEANGSYIGLGNGDQFRQQDFTITGWVKPDETGDTDTIISRVENNPTQGWEVTLNQNNEVQLFIGDNDANNTFSGTTKAPVGVWTFFACTYYGGDNAARVYTNSSLETSGTQSLATSEGGTAVGEARMGYSASFNANILDGDLDDIRYYPYELDHHQINAIYNRWTDFTPATLGDELHYYKMNGNVKDSAGNNNGSNEGVGFSRRGVRGQAGSLNGVDDRFEADYPSISGDFSVGAWAKLDTVGQDGTVIGKWSGVDSEKEFMLYFDTGNEAYRFILSSGASTESVFGSQIQADLWEHIFCTYSDTDGLKIYRNGELDGTSSNTITLSHDSSFIYVGDDGTGTRDFAGDLDEIRVYDKELSPTEVRQLYLYGTKGEDLTQTLINR